MRDKTQTGKCRFRLAQNSGVNENTSSFFHKKLMTRVRPSYGGLRNFVDVHEGRLISRLMLYTRYLLSAMNYHLISVIVIFKTSYLYLLYTMD